MPCMRLPDRLVRYDCEIAWGKGRRCHELFGQIPCCIASCDPAGRLWREMLRDGIEI
jgi:hypothetical protein